MKSPFNMNTTRSVVLDPCVKLALPAPRMTDAEYQRMYDTRVRRNEDRRLIAELERIAFFARQAE